MSDIETAQKERLKRVKGIIYTSIAEAKASMFHINDVGLLQDCFAAECDTFNRISMLKNIKVRIRQIERLNKKVA